MTEVPEHLLRRSKERRAAMGGGGEGGGASSSAVEPAAAASPAPSGAADKPATSAPAPAKAPAAPAYIGPPPPPPRKERVPVWAMPVLAALPLWAILYGGAFGERSDEKASDPVSIGAGIYRSSGCSGCHGPSGGGGVGPAMADTVKTFPVFADHVAWIEAGSKPVQGQPYGATGKVATGGMPGFSDSLSKDEIVAVVCYERVTFGKEKPPPECSAASPDAEAAEASAPGE
ncbi:MAG: c-type cytochrome [Actinobacteria bacterium]|nr:c-type cytochrome [Actinomycetota bacterium]